MTAKKIVPVGAKYEMLTVLQEDLDPNRNMNRVRYLCMCECGTTISVSANCLGRQYSCGCLKVLGNTTHGSCGTLTYSSWANLLRRCRSASSDYHAKYSAVGYDKSWEDFEVFLAHAGERPSKAHSIDRIDNSIGYFPGNVRWSTMKVQQRNRTNNRLVIRGDESITLAEAVEDLGLSYSKVQQRLSKYHKPLREALGSEFSWPNGINPYTGKVD